MIAMHSPPKTGPGWKERVLVGGYSGCGSDGRAPVPDGSLPQHHGGLVGYPPARFPEAQISAGNSPHLLACKASAKIGHVQPGVERPLMKNNFHEVSLTETI